MRIAFTKPAAGERFLVSLKDARRLVRAQLPDLELLAFQTMHGPKMDPELAYPITFESSFIRVLSIREPLILPGMEEAFVHSVLPAVIEDVRSSRAREFFWPAVVVAVDGGFYRVGCSEGGLFPSRAEVLKRSRGGSGLICNFT